MQNKSRWVEQNHQHRLRGKSEMDFPEFMAVQKLSRLEKWQQRRMDIASLHMRVAGQRYLDGHDLAAGWHSGVSMLLNPANIFHRVKRLFLASSTKRGLLRKSKQR